MSKSKRYIACKTDEKNSKLRNLEYKYQTKEALEYEDQQNDIENDSCNQPLKLSQENGNTEK